MYLKSSGSYAATKETKWDHLICDENGYAQTKEPPYSIYTLVEIQVPNDYVLDSTKMCIERSFPIQSCSFWMQRASDGVTGLAAGEYMLKEIAASDGYVIATDIAFTVDSHGQVIIEDTEVVTVTEEGVPYLVMVDGTVTEVVSPHLLQQSSHVHRRQRSESGGICIADWRCGTSGCINDYEKKSRKRKEKA